MKQLEKLAALFRASPAGVTAWQIANAIGSTCGHKRVSELRDLGWKIEKRKVDGRNFHRYTGKPPQKKPKTVLIPGCWPKEKA